MFIIDVGDFTCQRYMLTAMIIMIMKIIYIYIWSHLISHHTGMNVAHIDMNTDESIWFHTRVSACALAGVCVCTGIRWRVSGLKACVDKNGGLGIW